MSNANIARESRNLRLKKTVRTRHPHSSQGLEIDARLKSEIRKEEPHNGFSRRRAVSGKDSGRKLHQPCAKKIPSKHDYKEGDELKR